MVVLLRVRDPYVGGFKTCRCGRLGMKRGFPNHSEWYFIPGPERLEIEIVYFCGGPGMVFVTGRPWVEDGCGRLRAGFICKKLRVGVGSLRAGVEGGFTADPAIIAFPSKLLGGNALTNAPRLIRLTHSTAWPLVYTSDSSIRFSGRCIPREN